MFEVTLARVGLFDKLVVALGHDSDVGIEDSPHNATLSVDQDSLLLSGLNRKLLGLSKADTSHP